MANKIIEAKQQQNKSKLKEKCFQSVNNKDLKRKINMMEYINLGLEIKNKMQVSYKLRKYLKRNRKSKKYFLKLKIN